MKRKKSKYKTPDKKTLREIRKELTLQDNDFVAVRHIGKLLNIDPDQIDLNNLKESLYRLIGE